MIKPNLMAKPNAMWGVLALIVAIILPHVIGAYHLQIFIFAITYSVLGLSFRLSWKVGLPRLDVAAWWGVGAYTTATLMLKTGMSFWWTPFFAIIISVGLGYIVFSMSVRRGMMVFMMFGMVFALAIQQILGSVDFFGGWGGTAALPAIKIGSWVLKDKMVIYYFGLAFLIATMVIMHLLNKSRIGRAWDAIGSGLKLANSLGIDVVRYRLVNVLISNAFLALAGSFSVMYVSVVVPNSYDFNRSIYVIIYVLLGGFAYPLAGPIVGALVLTGLAEILRPFQEYEPIITGVLTILIIMFAPNGLLGVLDNHIKPLFLKLVRPLRGASGPPDGPSAQGGGS